MNIKRELRTWWPFLVLLPLFAGLANYQRPSVRQARLDAKLVAAVHSHDTSAAIEALNAGANPNVRDYYRPLPTLLIRLRHPDAAKLDDAIHAQEWDPVLVSAVVFGNDGGPSNQNAKIVQALLQHGAQINGVDFGGSTALSFAAAQGNLRLTKELLDHGAAINTQNRYRYTPLMNTGWPPSVALTRLLLTHGANPNLQGVDGETALMVACGQRRPDIVRLLLQHGADPNLRETPRKGISTTALQMEQMRPRPNPILGRLLKQYGAK
jgi:hypothetical protein